MRARSRTNLPGAIGNAVVTGRARGGAARAPIGSPVIAVVSPASVARKATSAAAPSAAPSRHHPAPVATPPPPPAPHHYDDRHFVYGTARCDLFASDAEVVVREGERALFVFPMEEDEEGNVRMRVKTAHPYTAQLSYRWVAVYRPGEDGRVVDSFSTTP